MSKNNNGFILRFRESKTFKGLAICVILNFFFEIIRPTIALALTEGPSQPEVQSFEPIGTTQMVDLFSGDFNYNIPLFNLPGPNGGYPVNLAYHAGTTMDDEASWVGLGWNINVGSLVRQMRGLPDEFKSVVESDKSEVADAGFDFVEVKTDIKQNWTLGLTGSLKSEIFGAKKTGNLNVGASVYYNNYNGVGLSLSANTGLFGTPFSAGLSLDSESGLGVSASVTLFDELNSATHGGIAHTLGVSYDGRLSVEYSLSASDRELITPGSSTRLVKGDYATTKAIYGKTQSGGFGSSVSFARNNFSPASQHRMNTYSLSINFSGGVTGFGIFGSGSAGIFYNTQDLSNEDIKGRRRPVAGYAAVGEWDDNDIEENYTLDFTRLNDGQITKSSVFLANSIFNYDVYNSTGQGLNGYFRPHRADIGRSYDPKNRNDSYGANVGIEFGIAVPAIPPVVPPDTKTGVDGGLNFGFSSQGPWDDENNLQFNFERPILPGNLENLYYKAHGEMTMQRPGEMDHINGYELPIIKLSDGPGDKQTIANNGTYSPIGNTNDRVIRNTLIHTIKNSDVFVNNPVGNRPSEFNINYFTTPEDVVAGYHQNMENFDRTTRAGVDIKNHPAGYKVLNEEGSYYVYGLPAYNTKEVENLFTVSTPASPAQVDRVPYSTDADNEADYNIGGTHKFINKVSKSPYAHSYMLTSVQGADYVDVSLDGPTDDDLGYWVKFNYLRSTDSYEWRAPYNEAQYHRGAVYTTDDDKASYQYGEKELWYVGQIETKSHIAIFDMDERDDYREANGEHSMFGMGAESGMQLNQIRIYDKASFKADPVNAVALQIVHFQYGYDLCKLSPNSSAASKGKLTLQKVWFTSNGSSRGEKNKYHFDYDYETTFSEYSNPNYKENTYDSWRGYKPLGTNYEHHTKFPYVNQFNQDWGTGAWEPDYGTNTVNDATKALTKSTQDELVSAWCLKGIDLPSGGRINIEYESDDYGYVQHKTANQMFKINKLNDHSTTDHELYDNEFGETFYDLGDPMAAERRRIYFKLEEPILVGELGDAHNLIYDAYVRPLIKDEEGKRNLYFKAKMMLSNTSLTAPVYDYVSGYLPLEELSGEAYGVDENTAAGGFFTQGFVTVQAAKKKNGDPFTDYHPMALAGWTYLQTNAQELLNNPNSLSDAETYGGARDLLNKLADLVNIVPATAASFGFIRKYCKTKSLARFIDLDNSCIRLASPDKIKYGGGHRVRQISIRDNWASDSGETDRTYGQVYDYTIMEDGKRISSGVAQYEPQAGGDENALKYPIHYFDKQTTFTNNALFAEGPVNESLFPGASVGYRKVTVKSLNTDTQIKNSETGSPVGRTGGVSVNEFYTSKEFPTRVDSSPLGEENGTKDVINLTIPIPLIGSIKRNVYHGTQAYKIELNDMHGKPKSMKSFELNNYTINDQPLTSMTYEYLSEPLVYQDENVFKLTNEVKVIKNDGTNTPALGETRTIGVEYDLFTDQRENKTFNISAGLDFNIDVAISFPFPSTWGSCSQSSSLFRTYVTNKVIHRSGVLTRTVSRDLQTTNETEILAYDEKSGQPVLSKVKNEFGDEFYSYSVPAYHEYDRMGHAYQNINYNFQLPSIHRIDDDALGQLWEFEATSDHINHLVRGDELIMKVDPDPLAPEDGGPAFGGDQNRKIYFLGWKYTQSGDVKGIFHMPYSTGNILREYYNFQVIRSGRRNHHSTIAANYLTKGELGSLMAAAVPVDASNLLITTPVITNNLLSGTASLFKDDWTPSDFASSLDAPLSSSKGNPFLTGSSGIWRPYKSYTYVGPRKGVENMDDNSSENPKLYEQGTMSDVKMFTWDLGDIENYIPNWEWVNEVTEFSSDAYELENMNRIGIYSSALYGYDNSLTIAVGGNASKNELGAYDFEKSVNGASSFTQLLSQTNMNFDDSHSSGEVGITAKYRVIEATSLINNELEVVTNIPYNFYNDQDQSGALDPISGLTLVSRDIGTSQLVNEGYNLNGKILSATNVGGFTQLIIKPFHGDELEADNQLMDGSIFHGKITLMLNRTLNAGQPVTFVSGKAHTGKKSMAVSTSVAFDQSKLKLIKDKKYILSLWISRDNTSVKSYNTGFAHIQLGSNSSGLGGNLVPDNITYGKIIEGWQKMDIEFSIPSDFPLLTIKINPGAETLYVDDIRFSPKTGGITTYVYDPVKLWLRASLNVDNYATLFFYDEEGNLTLKKQETEKGIFTITESRGHVSEEN